MWFFKSGWVFMCWDDSSSSLYMNTCTLYIYTYDTWYDYTSSTGFIFTARSSLLTNLFDYLRTTQQVVQCHRNQRDLAANLSSHVKSWDVGASKYLRTCVVRVSQYEMSQQLQSAIDGSSWAMVISKVIHILTVGRDNSNPFPVRPELLEP